jgi:hypothetical protein
MKYDLIGQLNDLAEVVIEGEVCALLEADWSETLGYYRPDLVEKYLEVHTDSTPDGLSVAALGDALIEYLCDFQERVIDVHCDQYSRSGSFGISLVEEIATELWHFKVGRFVMRRSDRVKAMLTRMSDVTIHGDYGYVYAPMHVAVNLYAVPAPAELIDMYS